MERFRAPRGESPSVFLGDGSLTVFTVSLNGVFFLLRSVEIFIEVGLGLNLSFCFVNFVFHLYSVNALVLELLKHLCILQLNLRGVSVH
jgi:hypothetical protein